MKKNHLKFTFLVSIVLFMFTAVFVGCETDEGETADTTELSLSVKRQPTHKWHIWFLPTHKPTLKKPKEPFFLPTHGRTVRQLFKHFLS